MPGRSRPAVAAMEARFLKYYSTNVTMATQYRLFDQNDTTNYLSRSTLTKNGAINPCMQSTYDFVKKIMTEVIKMHKNIQPLRVFHFGGDEAPPGSWVNSTACSDHHSHNVDLKRFFTFQVAQLAKTLGVVLGAWEDGVAGPTGYPYDPTQLGTATQVNAWNNIGEYGFARRAYDLANLGYQVSYEIVMSQENRSIFGSIIYLITISTLQYLLSNGPSFTICRIDSISILLITICIYHY